VLTLSEANRQKRAGGIDSGVVESLDNERTGSNSRSNIRDRVTRTRNNITQQRVQPGRTYLASYKVEISLRGSDRKATTKESKQARFST
jgi:hypothetical protein